MDDRDGKIHVLSHTLHDGCGAFEGMRACQTPQGTAFFRLREHPERRFNSVKTLRMKVPFTIEQVEVAQKAPAVRSLSQSRRPSSTSSTAAIPNTPTG